MHEFCKSLPNGWAVFCSADKCMILDDEGTIIVDAKNIQDMLGSYILYCTLQKEWYTTIQASKDMAILATDLLHRREPAEA